MNTFYQKTGKRPLYKDLADRISRDILAKGLQNGDCYCTMKSLCQEFQASFITVRNAVALLEQQGILTCRSAVGLCIHDINKLKLLNSFEKVVLILSIHPLANIHPFYSTRLIAMMRVLTREGFLPRVCDPGEINSQNFETQASLADGIISSFAYYDMIQEAGSRIRRKPKVFYSSGPREPAPDDLTGFVTCDDRSLFDLCREYLKRQTVRRIVYVHKSNSAMPEFLQKEWGSAALEYIYTALPSVKTGKDITEDLMKWAKDCFFWLDDDYVSMGFHQTLLERGINLIRDHRILVTASPAMELTEQMGFPVVGFNPSRIGELAAESLVQMIQNPGQIIHKTAFAVCNRNIM